MMKKIFNKKVFSFLLTVLTLTVFMSAMVFAAGEEVRTYIESLTRTIRTVAVAFIALAACTTAVLYMVGSVNPKLKDKGKDALYALIIGVVVLVFSGDIANWIQSITNKEINNTTGEIQTGSITITEVKVG